MMSYEKEYELRAADFDRWDRMQPASILSLFQDVAGIHANELGIGFAALMANQTIWVLTKDGIVEKGSHQELMAKKGKYYELYSMYTEAE